MTCPSSGMRRHLPLHHGDVRGGRGRPRSPPGRSRGGPPPGRPPPPPGVASAQRHDEGAAAAQLLLQQAHRVLQLVAAQGVGAHQLRKAPGCGGRGSSSPASSPAGCTGMPRWASCQAASQPARPAPMIFTGSIALLLEIRPPCRRAASEVFWGFRPAARGGRRTALSSVAAYAATPSPQEGEGFSGGWKPPLRVPFGLCAPAVPMSGPRLCTGTGPRPARPIDTGRGTEAPSSVAAYAATPSPRGNAFRTAGSRPCGFPSAFARPPSP